MTDVGPQEGAPERDAAFYSTALREVASKTAGVTGDVYFRTLVRSLAESFQVYNAFVAEFSGVGSRVKQLARWVGGEFRDPREFDTAISPCRDVIAGQTTHYLDGLSKVFPREAGYESYLGVPLVAEDGSVMGHLALLDRHPFEILPDAWMVLKTFASRAAVELSRRRTHDLLESTMASVTDAILVVGPERRVSLCNPATERIFKLASGAAIGRPLGAFLSDELHTQFEQYAALHDEGDESAVAPFWSTAALLAMRSDGHPFPVDITVYPTAFGGRTFYTVVLRNLEERRAAERAIQRLSADNALLQSELRDRQGDLLGSAPAIRSLLEEIEQVAPTDATVLIAGETGTGKELVARAVHKSSARRERILVTLNCATLPRELIESELFGHEKGAFTGATQRKRGRFELADGGTIFLDEVGELSLEAQAKLLRVLQEREVERLGGERPISVDVRVIAATNRDLATMVAEGTFRADLYYRLEVFPLRVPPLRQRSGDVSILAHAFLENFARTSGKALRSIDAKSLKQMQTYGWPGNVRELRNVIERATILYRGDGDTLKIRLEPQLSPPESGSAPENATLDEIQRAHILGILERTTWTIDGPSGAATVLDLHPNTLRSRMKKLGISRN